MLFEKRNKELEIPMQIIIACFNVSKIAKLCLANYIESRTYLSTDKPQTEIYLIEKNL